MRDYPVQEGHALSRYRYRTTALTGPWRDTREDAMRDAARAKQAVIDDEDPEAIRWIVPGRIEEMRQAATRSSMRG
jgi:hypothetical protein